jgi:hypothetical protein
MNHDEITDKFGVAGNTVEIGGIISILPTATHPLCFEKRAEGYLPID